MSGTQVKTAQAAAEAAVDNRGRRSYTAPYLVKMDDAGDGPAAVLNYLASRNIYFNVPYEYNGDVDSTAFCNGITPRRRPGSVEWWDITVTYGPPEEEDPQTPDGYPSDEPEDWRWQHNMGYSTWQEAAWEATNTDPFPHVDAASVVAHAYTRNTMSVGPIVNSANITLDPPLMRDRFDRVWQVTTYSRTYNSRLSDVYMGSINSDWLQPHPLLVANYGFVADDGTWPAIEIPYRVKCTNATATARTLIRNQLHIPYWEWHWEFRFRQDTWVEYVLDQGLTRIPAGDEPHAALDPLYPDEPHLAAGDVPASPVLDSEGRRVPQLVLFDGAGYPMLPSDPKWTKGYYFGWLKDTPMPFAYPDIPFPFFTGYP